MKYITTMHIYFVLTLHPNGDLRREKLLSKLR